MSKLHLQVLDQGFDVTVSPTFLSESECPFAMKSHRIDGFQSPASWNLEVGKAVHGIFEGILQLRLKGKPVDEEAVDGLFRSCVGPLAIPHIAEITRMVKMFLTNFDADIGTIAGIEEEVCLDENGERTTWDNAYVGGYLDLVQIRGDSAKITDHKTQWNILSRGDLDKHFQLTFYAVLLRKLYPHLKNFEVAINYARHGFVMASARTSQQLDECEHQVQLKIEQLSKIVSWDPIPGEHCTVCDAMSICPVANDLSEVVRSPVVTQQQAEKAAGRLRVLELVRKDLVGQLQKYSSEHGDVRTGNTWAYGYRPTRSYEYDQAVLTEQLTKHGYSIEPVLRVAKTELTKLLKRIRKSDESAYDGIISAAGRPMVKTAFKGYKVGADDDDGEEGESE